MLSGMNSAKFRLALLVALSCAGSSASSSARMFNPQFDSLPAAQARRILGN
jgi:hypothetical protein